MKNKLKFLPFHLITALPMLVVVFTILIETMELKNTESIMIAGMVYIYDVIIQSKIDYLEDEISKCSKINSSDNQ